MEMEMVWKEVNVVLVKIVDNDADGDDTYKNHHDDSRRYVGGGGGPTRDKMILGTRDNIPQVSLQNILIEIYHS